MLEWWSADACSCPKNAITGCLSVCLSFLSACAAAVAGAVCVLRG